MMESLESAIQELTKQVFLLRQELRPELKKTESFQRRKNEQEKLLEDIKNYQPRRANETT